MVQDIVLRDVPEELTGDPRRMTALCLQAAGRLGVILVAGPGPDKDGSPGRFTVSALREGWIEPLWATARGSAPVQQADLVMTGPETAMLLLSRRAVIGLAPRDRARLLARGRSLPDRLFVLEDEPVGVSLRTDGQVILTRLGPDGRRIAGRAQDGPRLLPGQRISRLMAGPAGQVMLMADDPARGFQLWRQEPGGSWLHLIRDGAGRFAQNAAVLDATLWQGRLALAVGTSEDVQENLHGLPLRGEILLVDAAGAVTLLCGELRPGKHGLMVPLMAPAALRAMGTGRFLRIAASGAALVGVMHSDRDDRALSVLRLTPAGVVTVLNRTGMLPVSPLQTGAGGRISGLVAPLPAPETDTEPEPDAATEPEESDGATDGEDGEDAAWAALWDGAAT